MNDIVCKTFQLYCDSCHWKKITDGKDLSDLHEIKVSQLQAGIPKKAEEIKFKNQKRRFRCPQCGHPIIPKSIVDQQATFEARRALEEKEKERQELEDKILKDQGKYEQKNRTSGN